MSNIVARFATTEPTACAVCRRHAIWVGYTPKPRNREVIWLCDDNACHALARRIYTMPAATLDAFEIGAVLEAGSNAGGYLEEIGKTDLAALDANEWREFLRRIVVGYEQALRRKILANEAPF
jgi:hypothetical protein